MTDTNAGPVLPELSGQPRMQIALFDEQGNGADDRVLDYGRQCAENVAGPLIEANASLRERVAELERERDRLRADSDAKDAVIADSRRLATEIGQALDGAGSATAPSLCDLIEPARKLRMQHDMLRAESTIEWEPGRSYTTAKLLRQAIRGLRVRKDRDLWPAVRNMCGVGSGVAHFLCRWAGRDPDTGATIEGTK